MCHVSCCELQSVTLCVLCYRHDYERAIHLDPHCMKARVNLAFSYQMVGHFQKAWNELTVAIAVDDSTLQCAFYVPIKLL